MSNSTHAAANRGRWVVAGRISAINGATTAWAAVVVAVDSKNYLLKLLLLVMLPAAVAISLCNDDYRGGWRWLLLDYYNNGSSSGMAFLFLGRSGISRTRIRSRTLRKPPVYLILSAIHSQQRTISWWRPYRIWPIFLFVAVASFSSSLFFSDAPLCSLSLPLETAGATSSTTPQHSLEILQHSRSNNKTK